MNIPQEIVDKYGTKCDSGVLDADAFYFTKIYDENPNSKVIVAGAHDESTANMLADMGNTVYGIDLRDYDSNLKECNYNFVKGDFCRLSNDFMKEHAGTVDAVVSLSAIEHFGLNAYQEGFTNPYYDIVALQVGRLLLRPGGSFYVTVPYGKYFYVEEGYWRIYNWQAICERFCLGYSAINTLFFVSGEITVPDYKAAIGELLSKDRADEYAGRAPHVTILARLVK